MHRATILASAFAALVMLLTAAPSGAVLSSSTCPSHVKHCRPDLNNCKMCHHSCKYCQHFGYVENGVCGPEDCMECLPGLRLDILWDDETGRCTDQPETFLETCPGHVEGCSSHNQCTKCHSTCKYCQGDTAECGMKDCMACSDKSLVLWDIFTDETGECLPRGVSFERHELTCPESVPGCHFDNRCIECDPSCDTCQSTETLNGICTASDCWTCRKGYEKHFVHADGRGRCVAPGHGDVPGEIPAEKIEIDFNHDRKQQAESAQGQKAPESPAKQALVDAEESGSSSTFLFFLVLVTLGGLYVFAQRYKQRQQSSPTSPTKKH